MIDLAALVLTCAPLVAQDTARALIQVESGGNPFAIGVVGGALVRQPANLPEALATVAALEAAGWNYSVGLGQINKRNFERYGLTPSTAFDACSHSFCLSSKVKIANLRPAYLSSLAGSEYLRRSKSNAFSVALIRFLF